MRTPRRWAALALVTAFFGAAVLLASPAAADVDCADLKSQDAAQTYLDGRTGDPEGLDTDADGRACEQNEPGSPGTWTLVTLVGLMAAGLLRFSTDTERQ